MDPKLLDEIDCESFFDLVEDFIDFPSENEGLGAVDCKDFPCIWDDTFPLDCSIFPSDHGNLGPEPDLSTELTVPQDEEILQLEWLSTFMEDSFADGCMTIPNDNDSINKEPFHHQFQTCSPISVLESSSSSSSSCSGGKTLPLSPSNRGTHRARSKRPRPPTFTPRSPVLSTSPFFGEKPQSFVAPVVSSEPEYFVESHPNNPDAPEQKKKKKLKLTFASSPPEGTQNPPAQAVRKCMHCEITKTPQWRAGPMGPKTLCNACGVRYKSGRLFPEYRPAASPTFVPSVHSNSHKKVLEMRTKPVEKGTSPFSSVHAPTVFQPPLQ